MRIRRLDLTAFGPFTGLSLDLAAGSPGGFHVIYGPNEAGKSSMRRAIRDLLYGFEHRTQDAHLHRSDALRVGALLEGREGELYVERRKARKDSLRDARGNVLDEVVLERLLGGIDRGTFTRTFGLGHEELKAGGEEMLRGEASIGETLFDAGAGGSSVKHLRERLVSESEALYRPRGKQQELNQLLERHDEARRRCQDALLAPERHRELREKLDADRVELSVLASRIEALRTELFRLRGLAGALPGLERRQNCLLELEPLRALPALPEQARERRERAQALEVEARAAAARLEEHTLRARRRLAEIEIPDGLLALGAERMAALADAIGRTRKARDDLPRIEAQKARATAEMAQSLRLIGRDETEQAPESLRVSPADGARIRKLATVSDGLEGRVEAARQRLGDTERDVFEQTRRLERVPPPMNGEALLRVAALSRATGDVEGPLAELEREQAALDRELGRKLAELGPFRGGAPSLAALLPPAPETVERLVREAAELRVRDHRLVDEKSTLARRLAEATARASAEAAGAELPSERELDRVRAERDRSNESLRAEWEAGKSFVGAAWHAQVGLGTRADQLADRLRREADRVALHARAEAERVALVGEVARVEAEQVALRESQAAHERALREVAVVPLSTAEELSGWLARRAQALDLYDRAQRLEEQRARLEAGRARLEQAVTAALGAGAEGEALSLRVERAAALDAERGQNASERRELERTLDALAARRDAELRALSSAERELADFRSTWRAALAAISVSSELDAEAALGLLSELATLAERSEAIEKLTQRVLGIRRDEARLAADVVEPARLLGLALDANQPDTTAGEIVERFHRATSDEEERQRLERELVERESELTTERERLGRATAELSELCALAGTEDPAELNSIETRSQRARELESRLEAIEATLVETSGGRSVADLVAEARGESAPRLQARIEAIEQEMAEVDEQRARAVDAVASLQAGISVYAEAAGADALQEEQGLAAAVRERIERYLRLRVAATLLERAVERYRLENQGPVLRRAGEFFSRFTGGAYVSLRVGKEEQAIAAVSPEGRELLPDALSEGTRYQLYLSLRLASIERHAKAGEPMPLILDDAIIHSDERRKKNAFSVLIEFSRVTQVLFFTHLEHDLALMKAERAEGLVFFHELAEKFDGSLRAGAG